MRTAQKCLLMIASMVLGVATAEAEDEKLRLRLQGALLIPTQSLAEPSDAGGLFPGGFLEVEADGTVGFGVGVEYLLRPRFGIEATGILVNPQIDAAFSLGGMLLLAGSDGLETLLYNVGFNYHLRPDKRVDIFFGPVLSAGTFGQITLLGETIDIDSDTVLGARFGLDVPLGGDPRRSYQESWSFHLGAWYIPVGVESELGGMALGFALEPVFLSAGLTYRF